MALQRTSAVLTHEEAVHRDPFSLQPWLAYLSHLSSVTPSLPAPTLFPVYERALAALPGSYKLWHAYTTAFRVFAASHHPRHMARRAAIAVSQRAARALRVSPVMWARYLTHLLREKLLLQVRAALSEALRQLPVTQHDHVWRIVCDAYPVTDRSAPAAAALWVRAAQIAPRDRCDDLLRVLLRAHQPDIALRHFASLLADRQWSPAACTRHDFYLRLARAAAAHATQFSATAARGEVDVPTVLRAAVAEGGPSVAELWTCLAEFHTRRAEFELARAVFEDAVTSTPVARDFALIYDAYARFEETFVTAMAESPADPSDPALEEQLGRLEQLVERRPMLLSDVRLRHNVHNVHEWHKRARMFRSIGNAAHVVDTYTKAIRAVDAHRAANGRVHTLWLAFARYYEEMVEVTSARRVLDAATAEPTAFRAPEELVAVWCEYTEMELRLGSIPRAIAVLRRATRSDEVHKKAAKIGDDAMHISDPNGTDVDEMLLGVLRSRRIWNFLIDLLQSGDDVDAVVHAHGRMLDLRIASAQSVLSGAKYFETRRLFERAYRIYDRAASRLPWPEALHVWVVYLTKFVQRFAGRKLERARDLFEEAIRSAPIIKTRGRLFPHPLVKHLYIMYFQMEERYSLGRHALAVLARAVDAVRREDCVELYRLYVVKTAALYGVSQTRPIYERALQELADVRAVAEFATRFAQMELRLGESDRARAVFAQTCHVVDTRGGGMLARFWRAWEDFEADVGNEDSMRDMMRLKRRVQLDHQHVLMNRFKDGVVSGIGDGGQVDAGADAGGEFGAQENDGGAESPEQGGDDGDEVVAGDNEKDGDGDGVVKEAGGDEVQKDLPTGLQKLMAAANSFSNNRDSGISDGLAEPDAEPGTGEDDGESGNGGDGESAPANDEEKEGGPPVVEDEDGQGKELEMGMQKLLAAAASFSKADQEGDKD